MVLPLYNLATSHGAIAVNIPSPRAFTPLSTTLTLVSRATRSPDSHAPDRPRNDARIDALAAPWDEISLSTNSARGTAGASVSVGA